MKKFLVILMVVAMASFLLVGCLGEGVVSDTEEEEEEEEEVVIPATVAPIIVGVTDGAYVNAVEAVDGVTVNGTAPTYSEVKIYINDICAGTGDTAANGTWTVVVAKADLGADEAKVLYATAKEAALDVSAKSNEKTFILDTVTPKISVVKARAGALRIYSVAETADTMVLFAPTLVQVAGTTVVTVAGISEAITAPFTAIPAAALRLPAGVVNWKIEVLTIAGVDTTVRVTNLTAGTFIDYTYTNAATVSTSWIPGAVITIAAAFVPATDVGAYVLLTTRNTPEVLGIVSLTFDEDLSYTGAFTNGNYTIWNANVGRNILGALGFTRFWTYNEASDTMFWDENVNTGGTGDLLQGDLLTFQVDSATDLAGNPIPVGTPQTANTVVLASTIVIAP